MTVSNLSPVISLGTIVNTMKKPTALSFYCDESACLLPRKKTAKQPGMKPSSECKVHRVD